MTATTLTAKLTTGAVNAIFRASGAQVEIVIHDLATNGITRYVVDKADGRKHYSLLRGWGGVVGATQPAIRHRKLTTAAQFAVWARAEFDLENDDNAPEAMLAREEEFSDCGFVEVAA